MPAPRAFLFGPDGVERHEVSSAPASRPGADRSQRDVNTRRVRTERAPRPLSATEERWLREQLLRRRTSADVAARSAAGSREASSMIERPTPAGAHVARAGGEIEAANVAATAPQSAAPKAPRASHVLAASGPDPALAPPAPPRFQDRPGSRFEAASPRASSRRTPRASAGLPNTTYRAVFACCTEATDTPTE